MSDFKLRPHHSLCIRFFEGKGYSSAFTKNMAQIKAQLEQENPIVEITMGADVICACCPHNASGKCETSEKVNRYDSAVLRICGFFDCEVLRWNELYETAQDKIIHAGRMLEVCGDCQWQCGAEISGS